MTMKDARLAHCAAAQKVLFGLMNNDRGLRPEIILFDECHSLWPMRGEESPPYYNNYYLNYLPPGSKLELICLGETMGEAKERREAKLRRKIAREVFFRKSALALVTFLIVVTILPMAILVAREVWKDGKGPWE